jgi:hypothetical protein
MTTPAKPAAIQITDATPVRFTQSPGLDQWTAMAAMGAGEAGWLRDDKNNRVSMSTPEGAAVAADLAFRGLVRVGANNGMRNRLELALRKRPALAQDAGFRELMMTNLIETQQAVMIYVTGLVLLADIATVVPIKTTITTERMLKAGRPRALSLTQTWMDGTAYDFKQPSDWRDFANIVQQKVVTAGIARGIPPVEGVVKIQAPPMNGTEGMQGAGVFATVLSIVLIAGAALSVFFAGMALATVLPIVAVVGLVAGGLYYACAKDELSSELASQKQTAIDNRQSFLADEKAKLIDQYVNETDPEKQKRIAEAIGIVTQDQNAPFNQPDKDPLGTQDMSGMIKTVAYAGVAIAGLWALSQYLGSRKSNAMLPSGDN